MNTRLPPPGEIAGHYNRLLQELNGEYIHQRWGDSEVKRRHFRHTELAISHALDLRGRTGDVLEIGCGPAVWTTLFLAQARSVSLLDISEEMLAQAKERIAVWEAGKHAAKVSYACGDFLDIDVTSKSFDTILSARAFEYMSNKQAFVTKCFSLLRPGGTLVLVTKNKGWHDSKKSVRGLVNVPREEIPVGLAMQLDLVDWHQAEEMFLQAGFEKPTAYPVILGTYEIDLLASRPALAVMDAVHRSVYRRALGWVTGIVDPLMESFLMIGRKPA